MYQREQFKILSDISNTLGAPAPKVENCPETVKFLSTTLGLLAPKVENCQENIKFITESRPEVSLSNNEKEKQFDSEALKIVLPQNVRKVILLKGEKTML